MNKSLTWFLIIGILILGVFLRLFFIKDGAVTFGYDQARDAFSAQEIINGHLKVQGPPASTPGLFHGVLYYYLIAPSYFLGSGNPVVTNIWLSIVNLLTIIPIYYLAKLLFSDGVALLAIFLFAISFDAVQYANWMSNPAPAVLTGAIFYLGLAMLIFKKELQNWGIILTALGLGLSIQFEVFLGYLFAPLIIAPSIFKIKLSIRQIITFLIVFVVSISSMIISYIKFGPTFIQGFTNLYSVGGDPFGAWRQFTPTLELYLNRFAEYFYRGLLPFNVTFAAIVGVLIVAWAVKRISKGRADHDQLLFLMIVIFSHGLLVPFGGNSTPFINAGLEAPVLILVAYFLVSTFSKNKLWIGTLTALIVFSSLYAIFKYNPHGQTVFAIQRGLTLKNELSVVDYTYKSSNFSPFSINTITSPLWINTTWAYLYNWYGQRNYHYLPSFHGRDQTGYLGSLPNISTDEKTFYLISEPWDGIPEQFAKNTIDYENSFSKVIEEKNFGGIIVQKRVLTKPLEKINFIK